MNLKFGILWLEDQFSDAEQQQIVEAARGHGFEVEVTNRADGTDLEEHALEQERHYAFDLILIDMELQLGANGVETTERARRLFPATPILFYSAKAPYNELREKIFKRGVEGVFVSHRNDFTRRAGELIGNLAASFNRLAGMRGLAARVLAECDDHHRSILTAVSSAGMEIQVQAKIEECISEAEAAARELVKAALPNGIEALLNCRAVTSQTLFKAVRHITKNEDLKKRVGRDPLTAARHRTAQFDSQVIGVRNTLGHVVEVRTENGWVVEGPGANDITVDHLPDLRRAFLENLAGIMELRRLLVPE